MQFSSETASTNQIAKLKRISAVAGGPHSTVDSILASRPAAPGSILGVPKIFSDKILDVLEIYRQHTLLRQWTVQKLIEPIQYWWEQYCKKKISAAAAALQLNTLIDKIPRSQKLETSFCSNFCFEHSELSFWIDLDDVSWVFSQLSEKNRQIFLKQWVKNLIKPAD